MVDSIAKTLGAGSGIDIQSLVTSLLDAQFQVKSDSFAKRGDTLTAQISAVSQLKSGISNFSTALQSLVKGGSLQTQPTTSNAGIVKATALPGKSAAGLASTVEVRQMAAAQVAATKTPLASTATLGAGTLNFQFGSIDNTGTFVPDATTLPAITVEATDTLSTLATKINAANQGITASIISDSGGQRLVMKGASGAARAFTLTAGPGSDPVVQALEVGAGKTGTEVVSDAADAIVAVDGVEVHRTSNTIDDLIPNVRIDLQSKAIGTKVQLGVTPPTAALTQAVNDFVETYNQLQGMMKSAIDPATGSLARDTAARDLDRKMHALTMTDLTGATDGSPKTLAEIGVATNRDGSLSVDATRLAAQLAAHPDAVERMFLDGAGASGGGLSAALKAVATAATSTAAGLGASEARYNAAKSTLADDKLKADGERETAKTRLTAQFTAMDTRVAAYKSTQAMLQQQIAAWNSSN